MSDFLCYVIPADQRGTRETRRPNLPPHGLRLSPQGGNRYHPAGESLAKAHSFTLRDEPVHGCRFRAIAIPIFAPGGNS